MKQVRTQLFFLFAFAMLSLSAPANATEAGYTYYSSSTHFDYYTDDTWTVDGSYIEQIETSLEASYTAFVDRYGFDAPYDGNTITIYLSPDVLGGEAMANGVIWLSTNFTGDDFYDTPAHELFHTIQYHYFTTADDYIMEGMAHWAQDVVDADYDALNTYMDYPPCMIEDLWGCAAVIRSFAIFWRYFSEQFAASRFTSLPSFGTQVIREVLEGFRTIGETEGRYVDMGDMDTILQNLTGDKGMTMTQFYKQFLTALYAKDLGNPFTNEGTAWVSYPVTKAEVFKTFLDGVSPYDFVEDEEADYPDLVLYSDGDLLSADSSLSYTNTGVIYHSYYSTDGFQEFGQAEPIRIEIDSDVTAVEFEPTDIDDNIDYVMAVQYRVKDGRGKRIRMVDSLTDDAEETISLATDDYPSDDFRAKYLIIFPFTMDDDPSDETGNNFEFTVTGL